MRSHDVAVGAERMNSSALLAAAAKGTIASLPTPPPEVNLSPLGFGVGAPPGAGAERGGFGETSGASKVDKILRRRKQDSSPSPQDEQRPQSPPAEIRRPRPDSPPKPEADWTFRRRRFDSPPKTEGDFRRRRLDSPPPNGEGDFRRRRLDSPPNGEGDFRRRRLDSPPPNAEAQTKGKSASAETWENDAVTVMLYFSTRLEIAANSAAGLWRLPKTETGLSSERGGRLPKTEARRSSEPRGRLPETETGPGPSSKQGGRLPKKKTGLSFESRG
eukprot:symbB.v1.2.035702.t1/scaffold4871.1/size33645/1